MDAGTVGGIIGGLIGLAGGVAGTFASVHTTRGPRERQLIVRAAVAMWAGIGLFLALHLVLPSPYRWLIWIPYGMGLALAVVTLNRKQRAIRSEEERSRQA